MQCCAARHAPPVAPACRRAPRSMAPQCSAQQRDGRGSPAVTFVVALATEALRLTSGGGPPPNKAASTTAAAPGRMAAPRWALPWAGGGAGGVLRALRRDYGRSYFVTGDVSLEIYEDDALFADPTISFRGRERYRSNLLLLVPFLIEPSVRMRSLRRLPAPRGAPPGSPTVLRAEWVLSTGVRLPWKPHVLINGATEYTLNGRNDRITRHVESWDVSPAQALGLLLRPGRAPEAAGRSGDGRRR